jgi:hypothetical protein
LVPLLVTGLSGCKRKKRQANVEDDVVPLATMVHAADTRGAFQLVRGFHGVEQNAWRWTAGEFAVTLQPPSTAAQKGATLQLKLVVPEVVLTKFPSVTLSAEVNGHKLEPETYSKSGDYTYSRDVPATALQGEAVNVEFTLDHYIPASPQDARDLGIIMTMVGFEAKP